MLVLNLKKVIAERGVSVIDLAERVGVTRHTISAYNCGRSVPPEATLEKIASVLGVSVEDLFEERDPSEVDFRDMAKAEVDRRKEAGEDSGTPFFSRMKEVAKAMHLNDSQVYRKTGMSVTAFHYTGKSGSDISPRNVDRFLRAFPMVSPQWLIFGEGEMFQPVEVAAVVTDAQEEAIQLDAVCDEELTTSVHEDTIDELRRTAESLQEQIESLYKTAESQRSTISLLTKLITLRTA